MSEKELFMKTVLYIDDNEEMIELVKIVLANSGYRILSQTDGQAALIFCANENPDLVLMDLNMPDMDGFETTQQLRKQGFTNPIVVFTALETDEDREKAIAAGCNDYVVKDMEMRGLEKIIDSFIADSGGMGM
jgi:CheY-like chemotaxis protein